MTSPGRTASCRLCGRTFPAKPRGPLPWFCSPACRWIATGVQVGPRPPVTCEWCGATIAAGKRGPLARYCPRPKACRQRSYEARHGIPRGKARRR